MVLFRWLRPVKLTADSSVSDCWLMWSQDFVAPWHRKINPACSLLKTAIDSQDLPIPWDSTLVADAPVWDIYPWGGGRHCICQWKRYSSEQWSISNHHITKRLTVLWGTGVCVDVCFWTRWSRWWSNISRCLKPNSSVALGEDFEKKNGYWKIKCK